MKQYFHANPACCAGSAGDPDCICWHDVGTGPLYWRDRPDALCTRPPAGWVCSRPEGHTGPCAASPVMGEGKNEAAR